MASSKTKLIKSADVRIIVNLMLTSWAAKATAAQGGRQMVVSGIVGTVWSEVNAWDGDVPTWSGGDTESVEVDKRHVYRGVMTLESARQIVSDAAEDARKISEEKRSNRKLRIPGRRRLSINISKSVLAKERLFALAALEARTLKKNRRVGRQKISTASRRSNIPESGRFLFGGRTALRMPVGRPALPEDTWLARYFARKNRRQIKNATSIKRNRGLPTVPHTKFGRPNQIELLSP